MIAPAPQQPQLSTLSEAVEDLYSELSDITRRLQSVEQRMHELEQTVGDEGIARLDLMALVEALASTTAETLAAERAALEALLHTAAADRRRLAQHLAVHDSMRLVTASPAVETAATDLAAQVIETAVRLAETREEVATLTSGVAELYEESRERMKITAAVLGDQQIDMDILRDKCLDRDERISEIVVAHLRDHEAEEDEDESDSWKGGQD